MKPLELLKEKWGYSGFRLNQEEIIQSVLKGKDCIALLPTGGGKSICYQVPGLLQEGLTLVISPLISLMQDQVNDLQQRGIKAVALTSGYSKSDLEREVENCQNGYYKFLFVSPERLISKWLRERLAHIKINLIAIDEAHCISQWGHDFRPPYLSIHEIREFVPNVAILALTATANTNVLKDIESHLGLHHPEIYRNSFLRNNIAINIKHVEDKVNPVLNALTNKKETGLVYVRSRRKTLELAKLLMQHGIAADSFNSGLSMEKREKRQCAWMNNQTSIMVATTAFGMGINKADVRTVIHPDLPEDLESYYQEIGRAGRDGKMSDAFLFYNTQDFERLKYKWLTLFPSRHETELVYNKLCTHLQISIGTGELLETPINLLAFCNKYGFNAQKTLNAFSVLHQQGLVEYLSNQSKSAQIRLNLNEAYENILANEEEALMLIKTLVRSYGGIGDFYTKVDLNVMAKRLNQPKAKIASSLEALAKRKLLWYQAPHEGESIVFLQNRVDPKYFHLDKKLHANILKMRQFKFESLKRFVEEHKECRNKLLLAYFDENLETDCGICDNCQKRKPVNLKQHILDALTEPLSTKELLNKLPSHFENEILQTIRTMLEIDELKKEGVKLRKS